MSYYQGDYYRGGFFSFLGGLAKKAVGFIPGVGPIASNVISGVEKVAGAARASRAGAAIIRGGGAAGRAIAKHPVLSAAAAAGAVAGGASMARRGAVHPALAAAAGLGRRRKRINVCNPRALRRAIRRTHGFAKLAMKTIHLVHPKKHARFGGFKRRRKK